MNIKGMIDAFTIGAAASELGIRLVKAMPKVVKVAAPRIIVSKNATMELVGRPTSNIVKAIRAMIIAKANDTIVLCAILLSRNIINGKGVPLYRFSTPISLFRVNVIAIPV